MEILYLINSKIWVEVVLSYSLFESLLPFFVVLESDFPIFNVFLFPIADPHKQEND